ncbi:MAG: hypothetical protein GOV00_01440 [Candidatus Altiarchaeota archaeon]|nr:hypothetical protein [Candidatus Altiarchaeota archaeon]
MTFIDLYVGGAFDGLEVISTKLSITPKVAGKDLLITNVRNEVRKEREKVNLLAAMPETNNQLTQLLIETRYDFVIIHPRVRLGKRAIRMSKRYETPLVFPVEPLFELRASTITKARRNLLRAQQWNGFFALSSGARKVSDLRAGPEIASIGILLGLNQNFARKAVEVPNAVVERAEKRKRQLSWGIEAV